MRCRIISLYLFSFAWWLMLILKLNKKCQTTQISQQKQMSQLRKHKFWNQTQQLRQPQLWRLVRTDAKRNHELHLCQQSWSQSLVAQRPVLTGSQVCTCLPVQWLLPQTYPRGNACPWWRGRSKSRNQKHPCQLCEGLQCSRYSTGRHRSLRRSQPSGYSQNTGSDQREAKQKQKQLGYLKLVNINWLEAKLKKKRKQNQKPYSRLALSPQNCIIMRYIYIYIYIYSLEYQIYIIKSRKPEYPWKSTIISKLAHTKLCILTQFHLLHTHTHTHKCISSPDNNNLRKLLVVINWL